MRMKYLKLFAVIALTGVVSGCGFLEFIRSLGFNIHTTTTYTDEYGRTRVVDYPFVIVIATWQKDFSGAAGNTTYADVETNENGRAPIGGGRAPAIWQFNILGDRGNFGLCRGSVFNGFTTPLGTTDIFCPRGIAAFFTADPSMIDVQAPPPSVTLTGQGINTTYGMPVIEFWDEYGTLVGQTQAAEVSPDGTWARGTTPAMDPNSMYGGAYTVSVSNAMSDGTYSSIGFASLSVTNSNPPPPPEPEPEPEPQPCINTQMECYAY